MSSVQIILKYMHLLLISSLVTLGKKNIRDMCYCQKHEYVDCSYRSLTEIPFIPKTFVFKTLNFNGNNILQLSTRVLRDVPHNITYMFFDNCGLKTINHDSFRRFSQLQKFSVGDNDLNKISIQNLFQNFHFPSLNISGNDFGQFGKNSEILISNKMKTLFLNNCNISSLIFIIRTKTQMQLVQLELRWNEITGETLKVFGQYGIYYNHLRYVDLSSNPLSNLSINTFSMLKDFRRLILRDVYFKSETISFQGINSSTLRYLDLSGSLTMGRPLVFQLIFKFLPSLNTVILSRSSFAKVTDINFFDMLSPLKNLSVLDISDSLLSFIPHLALQSLSKLKVLDLSRNQITGWEDNCFNNISSTLKILYLDRNNITMINRTSFPSELLGQLEKLILYGNPFSCVCLLHWFRNWMRDSDNYRKLEVIDPKRNGSYICYSPPKLNNTFVVDFDPYYEMCHFPTLLFFAGLVISLSFVSTIGLILMKKFYVYKRRKGYEKIGKDCPAKT